MGEAALYGLMCFAALGFTSWGRKACPPAFYCALVLCACCVLTNLLNHLVPYPNNFKPYPVINLICGGYVCWWLFRKPQFWSLALSLSFLAEIGMETQFAVRGGYRDYGMVYDYMAKENLVFSLQLLTVCMPGALDVLGRLIRRLLHDPRWHIVERIAFWRSKRTTEKG